MIKWDIEWGFVPVEKWKFKWNMIEEEREKLTSVTYKEDGSPN